MLEMLDVFYHIVVENAKDYTIRNDSYIYTNLIKPFVNVLRTDQIRFSYQESDFNTQIWKKESQGGYCSTKLEETPGKEQRMIVYIKITENKDVPKKGSKNIFSILKFFLSY
jgi:hypothetical protein